MAEPTPERSGEYCAEAANLSLSAASANLEPPPWLATLLTAIAEVRQFLGLAGYFRRYIYDYARRISCITKLTRQDEPFEWGEEQECVRQQIIAILTSSPVLRIFDPTLETELHTDASAVGYGAILFQKHDKTRHVVAYYSRATQEVERYMRTIANLLRVESARRSEWTSGLWKIQLIINSTHNKTTGTTRQARRQLVSRRLKENATRQEIRTNSKAKPAKQFERGDFVLLYRTTGPSSKMDSDVKGPYQIANCLGRNRYTIENLNSHSRTSAVAEDLLLWPVDWTPEDCASLFSDDNDLQESVNEVVQEEVELDDVPLAQRLEMFKGRIFKRKKEDLIDDMPLLQRLQLAKTSR